MHLPTTARSGFLALLALLAFLFPPSHARAIQPFIIMPILTCPDDPTEAIDPTTGTLARLDGSVYVCTNSGGQWYVDTYAASRYAFENQSQLLVFDVSHPDDSGLIAAAILDSRNGEPMGAPEQRGYATYVVMVGRLKLYDETEELVLEGEGTYLVSGTGLVQYTPGE